MDKNEILLELTKIAVEKGALFEDEDANICESTLSKHQKISDEIIRIFNKFKKELNLD